MSINSISSASFNIEAYHDNAYALSIQFSNNENKKISEKSFIFTQTLPPQESKIWDVYTKNSTCHPLKKIFRKPDVDQANLVFKHMTSLSLLPISSNEPLIATFDFQDSKSKYLDALGSIAHSEVEICDFIKNKIAKGSEYAKNIHSLFKNSIPLDFLMCEGSLKKDLLTKGGFAPEQIVYLNSSKGNGSKDFCQMAEFFMNGFKFGQSIQDNAAQFNGKDYIQPISNRFEAFKPGHVSTTFYPPEYKDMYALDGPFAEKLSSVFVKSGGFSESTQITTLKLQRKI